MDQLAGKVAVITGATSGIGAHTARVFVAEGASVVISGRREAEGEALAAALGPAASFVRADVAIEDDVAALIAAAVARHGRLDCLCNNAGSPAPSRRLGLLDLDAFDDAMAVHVRGTLAGMKHAAPVMTAQGSGSIINTASINGRRAGMTGLTYSTAKAAVIHATRCAAVELGAANVRVNSLSPGPVLTGIFAKGAALGDDDAEAERLLEATAAAFAEFLPATQPLPRMGTTEDVARAAVFLAADASAFITGHDLVVDGGMSAGRPASVMRAEARLLATALQP
jgi:NAD(P)-dependent dehydrogenase (short-subunit alcohol dehydrogenase family)